MRTSTFALAPLAFVFTATLATTQVPQGHYVFGTFGSGGEIGLYVSHPRTPGVPTAITGLVGDLKHSGSSCVVYRASDGAILVGERAPTGSSVDLHMIHIQGMAVVRDASFSVGTGGSCCGEIPQMGLLPDGRVVVAATDIAAGPLSNYQTTSYGWQGVGIIDTASGLVTPLQITNAAQIVDVFNGLAVAPDGSAVYVGTWGATSGDIWRIPLPSGGTATLVAATPVGLSNMGFDNDGTLWVTTLDATQGLFRVDVTTGVVTNVPTTAGSLNAVTNESVTGNFAVLTGRSGTPPRSIFWMEPDGTEHLLSQPGLATASGVAIHLNPARFGNGTPAVSRWDWVLAPNPGGLPLNGNPAFSLTVASDGTVPPNFTVAMFCGGRLAAPVTVLGAELWVDPTQTLASVVLPGQLATTIDLAIPNDPSLTGASLCMQTFHMEAGAQLSASPGLQFTIL